jgi:GcrA cell cycle regulator
MSWTDAQVERLEELVKEGRSYGEISGILHREMDASYTRNACIGKATRLGIATREKPSKPEKLPPVHAPSKPTTVPSGRRLRITQRSGVGAFVLPQVTNAGSGLERSVEAAKANAAAKAAALADADTMKPEAAGRRTMETLCAHECRWPIGDPQHPSFSFCGRRSEETGPYCETHRRMAYQPAPVRKRLDQQIGITPGRRSA